MIELGEGRILHHQKLEFHQSECGAIYNEINEHFLFQFMKPVIVSEFQAILASICPIFLIMQAPKRKSLNSRDLFLQ